jgi:hypothetical protein
MGERKLFYGVCSAVLSLTVLLVFSLIAVPASAQEAGTILGTVKDTSGGTVPQAKITITNTDTNDARQATTGDDGAYRVPGLRPGHYTVRIEKDGFKTSTQTGVTLDVGAEIAVSPALEVGASTQEVTVTGEAPVVNTTTSTLGALVDDQRVSDLPLNGRNYIDLTLIQPGIQINTSPSGGGSGSTGTWFSSNGMPPRSNYFSLDGANIGNQYATGPNSISGTTLGVDGIKEYKIVTSMFGPEYGMEMGSQMIIVSKGGTNNWHGDVFEYLRNNHLDARNFFDPSPALLGGQRTAQFKRNNYGASVGGPIKKDKSFFYLVYEGLRFSQTDAIQTTTLPAACHFLNVGGTNQIVGGGPIPSTIVVPTAFQGAPQVILNTRPAGTVTMVGDTTTVGGASGCGATSGTNFSKNGDNLTNPTINPGLANMTIPWIGQFPFPNETNSVASQDSTGSPNYTFPGVSRAREDYGQIRIDQNISTSDTFFARYTLDDNRLSIPYASLSTSDTGTAYPQFFSLGNSRNQSVTFGENHIFSATVLNQVRLSFNRSNVIARPGINNVPGLNPNFTYIDTPSTPGSTCFAVTNPVCIWSYLPGQFGTGDFGPGAGVTGLSYNGTFPTYHPQNVWTLGDDVFITSGKHAFKFGILFNNFQDPSVMQKGAQGSTNSGSNIGQWLDGLTTSYLTVTPTPGTSVNGVLGPQYNNSFYLDKDYMFKTFGFYFGDDYRATSRLTLNLGLRYEFMTVPHELYGRNSTIPNIQGGSPQATVSPLFNYNWSLRNWSPRFGFAYDVFGNGKTAVRGGFGIYYDIANLGSMLTQSANGVPPFGAQTQVAQSAAPYTIPLVNSVGTPIDFTSSQFGHALQMNDPNFRPPHSLQYNLTVQQQLPGGIGLTVSYVGNRGINIIDLAEGNPVVPNNLVNGQLPPNTMPTFNVTNGVASCQNNALTYNPTLGGTQPLILPGVNSGNPIAFGDPHYPCRLNPYWTSALFITTAANSWYSGLQVVVSKHLSHGLDFQGAYTYSRSIDTTAGQMYNTDCGNGAFGTAVGNNPYNLVENKAVSCQDVPQSMHLSLLYHLPNFASEKIVSKVTNGWWFGNIVTINGGFPFTPLVSQDRSFSGVITQSNATYANLNTAANIAATTTANPGFVPVKDPSTGSPYNWIPFDPNTVILGTPQNWFNPLMFGQQALGTEPNTPRDTLRGPGVGEWDLSINKDTKLKFLGEQGALQFRAEIFNLLNRANFGPPSNSVFGGTVTNTALAGNAGGNIQAPTGSSATKPLGTVGQITTTSTKSRQIQLALKVVF